MPATSKTAPRRRKSGPVKGAQGAARARAKPAARRAAAAGRAAPKSVRADTLRSAALAQLQSDLRRAMARIAALEAVLRVTRQGDVTLAAVGSLVLQAGASVQVDGARVTLNCGLAQASNVLKCETLLASSVVSATYTPGAGNLV